MAVYYITFGTFSGLEEYCLEASPAANQKGHYIVEKLDEVIPKYEVISLSETSKKKMVIFSGKTVKCLKHGEYTVWTTFGKPTRLFRRLHRYMREIQIRAFLSGLTSEDTVIVYHSLTVALGLAHEKLRRNFKLVLELEEIYQDVVECSDKMADSERKVISVADGYILATEALAKEISSGKPYIVVNGTYRIEENRHVSFDDGKVHCVYAGTFDPAKGGAAASVAAAEFLPSNYHVHILGFGSEGQRKQLIQQIEAVRKKTRCTLTYEGLKSGEDYIQFLQKCQIGLCTQIPDAKYTETSFPSKILVYLANGLRVLSAKIPAVETSTVGKMLFYYENQSSQEIAKAIMGISIDESYDSRALLKQLDMECVDSLKQLMEKVTDEHN